MVGRTNTTTTESVLATPEIIRTTERSGFRSTSASFKSCYNLTYGYGKLFTTAETHMTVKSECICKGGQPPASFCGSYYADDEVVRESKVCRTEYDYQGRPIEVCNNVYVGENYYSSDGESGPIKYRKFCIEPAPSPKKVGDRCHELSPCKCSSDGETSNEKDVVLYSPFPEDPALFLGRGLPAQEMDLIDCGDCDPGTQTA